MPVMLKTASNFDVKNPEDTIFSLQALQNSKELSISNDAHYETEWISD